MVNSQMFLFWGLRHYLFYISSLWATGLTPKKGYSATQRRHLVVRSVDYQLIAGQLYKLGIDSILRCCVMDHKRLSILWECYSGVAIGHVGGKATALKIWQAALWWPTILKESKELDHVMYVSGLNSPSIWDELPWNPVRAVQSFKKWVVDFVRPTNTPSFHSKAIYIITATDYLTRLEEAELVK